MLARRQGILLCPGSGDAIAIKDSSYIEARRLGRCENIMLRTQGRKQHSYQRCDLVIGTVARRIRRQRVIRNMLLVLVREHGCPCMTIKMIIGEALQVLRLWSGRDCIVKHFTMGQVRVACNGKLIAKKVGGSLVGLKKLTRPT